MFEVAMGAQNRSLSLIAAMMVALVSLAGCWTKTVTRSSGSASIGSRTVKFSVDGVASALAKPDAATVTFPGGKVVVEKARVLVDDKEVAKLPEDAKLVEIDYTAGTLTVTADGTQIHEAKLR
jgi:hypothetical protein